MRQINMYNTLNCQYFKNVYWQSSRKNAARVKFVSKQDVHEIISYILCRYQLFYTLKKRAESVYSLYNNY